MNRTFYDILGVTKDATEERVRSRFKILAKAMHPDVNKSSMAEKDFMDLQEAFSTLTDPVKRREYDTAERRRQAAHTKPDDVDIALSTFDLEDEVAPRKKKKKKKKPPAPAPVHVRHGGEPSFEEIPEGYIPPPVEGVF